MIRINLARHYLRKKTSVNNHSVILPGILFLVLTVSGLVYVYRSLISIACVPQVQLPHYRSVPLVYKHEVVADTVKKPSQAPTLQTTVKRDTATVKKQTVQPTEPTAAEKFAAPTKAPAASNNVPSVQPVKPAVRTVQPVKPMPAEKVIPAAKAPVVVKKVQADTLPQRQSAVRLPKYMLNELAFADNVFDMLNRAIPAGVTLTTLSMDSCSTICIIGSGMCKDPIREMFATIKHEQVTILKPPQTYIKADKKANMYLFTISCAVRPGFCSDVSSDYTVNPATVDRTAVLTLFKKLASKNHIVMHATPRLVSTENTDGFIRTAYTFSAKTSYMDFGNFVQSIRDAKLPCAITGCVFDARYPSAVSITSQMVVITTR